MNVLQARRIKLLVAGSTAVGRVAPTVSGYSVRGEPVTLTPRGRTPTVLYYFTTTCEWCERNWANVKTLAAGSGSAFRFVAVSEERISADYLAQQAIQFEVIGGISEGTKAGLGLRGTPHTIVVSPEGIITHDWPGAYSARLGARLEDVFQVTLPGLTPIRDGVEPTKR